MKFYGRVLPLLLAKPKSQSLVSLLLVSINAEDPTKRQNDRLSTELS